MKIYILPINKKFQPRSAIISYPSHNKQYGIEQDFLKFLLKRKDLTTQNPKKAKWHYLPIYWLRWHYNHDYAIKGRKELQQEIKRCMIDDRKTFTICQYARGPLVNVGKTVLFFSSRRTKRGIDVPLISSPHKKGRFKSKKKYLASFIGRFQTHQIRQKMANQLRNRNDIFILNFDIRDRNIIRRLTNKYLFFRECKNESEIFVKSLLEAYIALCPRGIGGNSFRFYEAMQLGIVPLLISNFDARPFKKFIKWEQISFYTNSVSKLNKILNSVKKEELHVMGREARKTWYEKLNYGKWCPYVLKELQLLS